MERVKLIMKEKIIFCLTIIIIAVVVCAIGYIYYNNKYSLKNLTINEVKSATLFPFYSTKTTDNPYTYNKGNPDDLKAISDIIKGLNTGKKIKVLKTSISLNGGTLEHWIVNLTNGKSIEIAMAGNGEGQVLIGNAFYNTMN
jgi:hypothetical protein